MEYDYDLVVVGGGSAGFNAARVAASLGKRVAIVDGSKSLGGLCILNGCMPSKTLIYAAEVLHHARLAKEFGLRIPKASVSVRKLFDRKNRIIGEFADHRVRQLKSGKWDLIRAFGKFVDPHTLALSNGRKLTASNFLIGTGSKVALPEIPGLKEVPFWISDDVLDLKSLPKDIIVLGGGIVACELAQFLSRMGVGVVLVQRSAHLLSKCSVQASETLRKALEDEGVKVYTSTEITGITKLRGKVTLQLKHNGKPKKLVAQRLFNALGRTPNTSELGLSDAGVKTDRNGRIQVNEWQQTSAGHIYAAGDCCGPHEIVHVAIQQAELAARHISGIQHLRPVASIPLLSVVFTDPQIASVGATEAELQEQGIEFLKAEYPFNDHGKSILMNATYGYVKILAAKATGRILGAEIVGKDAGELIHCLTVPVSMKATVHEMLLAPWYHPTLAEIITYPLEEIAESIP